jgi:hypothetical protein
MFYALHAVKKRPGKAQVWSRPAAATAATATTTTTTTTTTGQAPDRKKLADPTLAAQRLAPAQSLPEQCRVIFN